MSRVTSSGLCSCELRCCARSAGRELSDLWRRSSLNMDGRIRQYGYENLDWGGFVNLETRSRRTDILWCLRTFYTNRKLSHRWMHFPSFGHDVSSQPSHEFDSDLQLLTLIVWFEQRLVNDYRKKYAWKLKMQIRDAFCQLEEARPSVYFLADGRLPLTFVASFVVRTS